MLLRPFPLIKDQDRLVVLGGSVAGASRLASISTPDLTDFRRDCSSIESFGERAERAPGEVVSANYFDALGVHPFLGRGFQQEEDFGRNAYPVAVISHQLWRERFHSDPAVIGRGQIRARPNSGAGKS